MKPIYRFSVLAALLFIPLFTQAGTLEDSKARGTVRCGINSNLTGFSQKDAEFGWKGFDVDICRAVASATLGDGGKVDFVPLSNRERLQALQQGRVDVLSRNTTWTFRRDVGYGLNFVGISYYDTVGFMVREEAGIRNILEEDNLSVCVQEFTTTVKRVQKFFGEMKKKYKLVLKPSINAAGQAYEARECDALTSDKTQLYSIRTRLKDPRAHRVLAGAVGKEPLSLAVRGDDKQWFDIVRWTLFTLINAEELGLNSRNIDALKKRATNLDVRFMLGLEGDPGEHLGLDSQWAYRVVKQVGNYAEVFDRNLGVDSPLRMDRGLNKLWRKGGLLFAPPMR